jgi:hypothetical protein
MATNNTSTMKKGASVKAPVEGATLRTKDVKYRNSPGQNDGQMRGNAQPDKFADPMNDGVSAAIRGLEGLHDDIGEKSGFITDGYIDKGGTPYGEAAKFNFLPPGMDISNQENAEIHDMPLRKITEESYPGDGWQPKPRDIPE